MLEDNIEKGNVQLSKFELSDLPDLERVMDLNKEAAGRNKDWKDFIRWNIENPDDLYWKIHDNDHFYGYIGFSNASKKISTRHLAKDLDLFLEIYIDPSFCGKGIGQKAFSLALKKILQKDHKKKSIFASTYIWNVKAQKFFQNKLNMKYLESNPRFNTVVYILRDI